MLGLLARKKKNNPFDSLPDNYQLPSFPASVMSALGKLRQPDVNMYEIARDLEADPGLHSKTLQTVNSVAFGLPHKVSNFNHAVSLLGPARLETLILAVVAKNALDQARTPDWFDMENFWLGSARRATLARILAQTLHPATQAEAFTAGLLQDMGVPIMADLRGADYQAVYLCWTDNPEKDLAQLEREALDQDHPELGAGIAQHWGFPEALVTAVSGHHDIMQGSQVDLAVRIVSLVKNCQDFNDATRQLRHAAEQLSLNPSQLEFMVNKALNDADSLAEILN